MWQKESFFISQLMTLTLILLLLLYMGLGLSYLDPYAMHRGGCPELYYCNMVEWSTPGGIQALSERPTGFLQCFDTIGLVIWPVKIVPDMTYNVFGGTIKLA